MTKEQASIPNGIKFLFGGSSGMAATLIVQPLDLVKNRMQLSGQGGTGREYKTSLHCIRGIIQKEGLFSLYNGLSAGLFRQATYTTTRLGVYTFLLEKSNKWQKERGGIGGGAWGQFGMKLALGCAAGGVGSVVGTPAEVSLIRMTSDGRLPVAEQRGYKNVFDSLIRISKEEGVLTLWRGCLPTVGRAMVVNAAQLATYSQAKQGLLNSGYFSDNILTHFCASMISGLATTIASMPVDIAKTRIQSMRVVDGKPEYKGMVDVWMRVVRTEGVFSLWKGFTPYYMRLGPHTVLTFIFLEQMNTAYCKHVLGVTSATGGL